MRFVSVLNKEIRENRKNLLIFSITVFLVLFFQAMAGAFFGRMAGIHPTETVYRENFPGFLFLGGFIVTSIAFSQDMFSRIGQHNWLTLPASALEKFLAKGLLAAIAYPVALIVVFTLSSLMIEALALLLFGSPFAMFNPLGRNVGIMLLHYVVTQSIFLLGATYFRKAHFVKTVLAIGVIGIVLGMLGTLFVRIAFAPYMTNMFSFHISIDENMLLGRQGLMIFATWTKNILYWIALPLFCWFTAYLRVKEVQATDAIQ